MAYFHGEPLWRRRKVSRTELRKAIAGKRRIPHGGRGKKYGLKSHRKGKGRRPR